MERIQIITGHLWLAVVFVVLLVLLSGCATETCREYYENGQVKLDYKREGFIEWSEGMGKQMPLSNIHVNGLEASLPDLKR